MKLIDTDVLIDHFHGHQAALDYIAQQLIDGETVGISVIVLTELLGGMRSGEEEVTERLLGLFEIQEVDEKIGRKASEYLRQFRRSYHLELSDAIIAATAFVYEAQVVTRNVKHYPMTDIVVITPYQRGRS